MGGNFPEMRRSHKACGNTLSSVDGPVPAFQMFYVREIPGRGRSLQLLARPSATPTGDPQTRSQPYCWQSRDGKTGTQNGMLRWGEALTKLVSTFLLPHAQFSCTSVHTAFFSFRAQPASQPVGQSAV